MLDKRIEAAIRRVVWVRGGKFSVPQTLDEAIQYSVFPGGARIRPTILLSVAVACGDDIPSLADAAAAALEMIHCASLVHDDLPCFDNAETRRGKPSVHNKFGQSTAVLVGDSLIADAFGVIAKASEKDPVRATKLISLLSKYTGFPNGICAGQAWENEKNVDLSKQISKEEFEEARFLNFSSNIDVLQDCNCFIVSVPTPVDKNLSLIHI